VSYTYVGSFGKSKILATFHQGDPRDTSQVLQSVVCRAVVDDDDVEIGVGSFFEQRLDAGFGVSYGIPGYYDHRNGWREGFWRKHHLVKTISAQGPFFCG